MSHIRESVEVQVVLMLCDRIASVKANAVSMCLSSNDFASYLALTIDPRHYNDAKSFADDYMLVSFLKKWEMKCGIDTRQVALESWERCESSCRTFNDTQSLDKAVPPPILFRARQLISELMGPCKVGACMELCEWSNGATFDVNRGATPATKMQFPISVTPKALPYLDAYLRVDTGWRCAGGVLSYTLTEGNRVATVAKNAKTDRVISIEPTGNIFSKKESELTLNVG